MDRKLNWPELLHAEIEAAQGREFAWGSFDCCLFSMDVVLTITGIDLAQRFRGKYKTARGAASQILKFCGGGVEDLAVKMATEQGIEEIPVAFAQRGDVVLMDTEALGPALGIAMATEAIFVEPNLGVSGHPLKNCRRAWRI